MRCLPTMIWLLWSKMCNGVVEYQLGFTEAQIGHRVWPKSYFMKSCIFISVAESKNKISASGDRCFYVNVEKPMHPQRATFRHFSHWRDLKRKHIFISNTAITYQNKLIIFYFIVKNYTCIWATYKVIKNVTFAPGNTHISFYFCMENTKNSCGDRDLLNGWLGFGVNYYELLPNKVNLLRRRLKLKKKVNCILVLNIFKFRRPIYEIIN